MAPAAPLGPAVGFDAAAPLVSADALLGALGDPDLRLLDVRWALGQPGAGRRAYEAGHLPGAVHLDIDGQLAGDPARGPGRHPLPEPDALCALLGASGLGDGHTLVAYDDAGGAAAARLWWLLGWLGHGRAHVLDGGLAAWRAVGGPLAATTPAPRPASFTRRPARFGAIDGVALRALLDAGTPLLLDARSPERYAGTVEPIDPRAGHIPGARSAPFAQNLTGEGRFRPAAALRARYGALGVDDALASSVPVVVYCGSGVTACHDALAMVSAGYPAPLLYEGSWSDYSRDEALPIATGPEPGEWRRR